MDDSQPVTGADVARFLAACGVSDDCPACGLAGGLSVAVVDPEGEDGGSASAVLVLQRLAADPSLGYGQFVQACRRCGHIRHFRDIEVLAFLDQEGDNRGE